MATCMPGEWAACHHRRRLCAVWVAARSGTPAATSRRYAVLPRIHCLTCKSRSRARIQTSRSRLGLGTSQIPKYCFHPRRYCVSSFTTVVMITPRLRFVSSRIRSFALSTERGRLPARPTRHRLVSASCSSTRGRPPAVALRFVHAGLFTEGLSPPGGCPCWAHKRKGLAAMRGLFVCGLPTGVGRGTVF